MTTKMEHKGFSARIMEAPRLTGESVHDLPPGTPLEVFPIDAFETLPENWMKGPGVFIVPVRPNKGLWFDWRFNSEINTAIIPTVKGCNPITGLQTSGFHMEKYEKKCPKHGCDFLAERFCPECNYKWPDRNYVSMSPSWWDGFRAEDGTVRQFFFSEDELRDIATHLIGKENTVPAFGFAFYSSKERRPDAPYRNIIHFESMPYTPPVYYGASLDYSAGGIISAGGVKDDSLNECSTKAYFSNSGESAVYACNVSAPVGASVTPTGSLGNICFDSVDSEAPVIKTKANRSRSFSGNRVMRGSDPKVEQKKETPVKEVSIGAGAKIRQDLNQDSYPIDSWKEAPDSVMTIYFVFHEKFEELKAGGMRDLSGVPNGFLQNCPVG